MTTPPIFIDSPAAVHITVDGDPFRTPWRLELRRPGMPHYQAECIVIMDKTASGEPHLRIHWKGHSTEHPADVMQLLQDAISKHIQEMLPDDYDLHPMPDPN